MSQERDSGKPASGDASDGILSWTAVQLRDRLRSGQTGAEEVCEAYLEQIRRHNQDLGCFLTVDEEGAREQARQAAKRLSRDPHEAGALAGVPVAVKDNIVTKGLRTTAASKILDNFIPPYDASVVTRLRRAGAVILGKTNLDEFAMGSSTENSAYFPTRNPHDRERVPGGSSGGSAAAVAARLAPAALGSDTGGSIRQPAAFCGVSGLKPTYGRVSRYGLIAFGSSLDQIGPITRDVRDAALLMDVLAGHDPQDATSSRRPAPDFSGLLERDRKPLRIGVPRQWMGDGLQGGPDPEVKRAVQQALEHLESQGCRIEDVSLPHSEYAIAAYYIVAPAEASSNLMRYDGVRYGLRADNPRDLQDMYRRTRTQGFGDEVKRRIMLGTFVLSAGYIEAFYSKAARTRRVLLEDYRKAFAQVDLIAGPVAPTPAFKLGEKTADPWQMYLSDIYTVTANLTGIPALSVPLPPGPSGLPLALQLQAPHFQEPLLLQSARLLG
ncbi:MAG TPA: Asp-tRNA(Asn)/Glu-tRNA(Gln) amidotransferase subunit GatA [Acidobacteriota bacterium]|nr:Asp-tRNA(Asn)/Glu-tRNA(Gln) amidotransferase subunit GatA [Acidobacteriota bacterium]